MRRQTTWKSIVVAGLLGIISVTLGSTSARASDLCAPARRYAWVTTYVPREVAYTRVVTLHDHYGRPYKVARTCYETVNVPVKTRVLVCN